MKNYLVKVSAMLPYPTEKQYREEASNMATASARAIRKFRKENGGRKITTLRVQIIKL